jgi:hypothetical protein
LKDCKGWGLKWCFCLVFVLDTGDLSLDRYLTDKRLSTRWCRRHRCFQNTTWPLRCCEVQRNSVMRIIVSGNYEYNLMSGIVRLCSDDSWRLGKLRSVAFLLDWGEFSSGPFGSIGSLLGVICCVGPIRVMPSEIEVLFLSHQSAPKPDEHKEARTLPTPASQPPALAHPLQQTSSPSHDPSRSSSSPAPCRTCFERGSGPHTSERRKE